MSLERAQPAPSNSAASPSALLRRPAVRLAVGLLLVVIVGACSVAPDAFPARTPSVAPAASASEPASGSEDPSVSASVVQVASPVPTLVVADPVRAPSGWPDAALPPGDLPASAAVERDGVRVSMALDRSPLIAGEPAFITTEVTNAGRKPFEWYTDGCGVHVGVSALLVGLKWRMGAEQPGIAGEFKEWALWDAGVQEDGVVRLDIRPDWAVGLGDFGCADLAQVQRLEPGESVGSRLAWDGLLFRRAGLPPTSQAQLTGRFTRDAPRMEVAVPLTTWIQGVDSAPTLSAAEAIDVALGHGPFAAWVLDAFTPRFGETRWQSISVLDVDTGVWHIGLAVKGGDTRIAVVDSSTSRVVDYLHATTNGGGGYKLKRADQ